MFKQWYEDNCIMTYKNRLYSVGKYSGEMTLIENTQYTKDRDSTVIDCKEALADYSNNIGVKGTNQLYVDTRAIRVFSQYSTGMLKLATKVTHLNLVFINREDLCNTFNVNSTNLNKVLNNLKQEGMIIDYSLKGAIRKGEYKVTISPTIAYRGNPIHRDACIRAYLTTGVMSPAEIELPTNKVNSNLNKDVQVKYREYLADPANKEKLDSYISTIRVNYNHRVEEDKDHEDMYEWCLYIDDIKSFTEQVDSRYGYSPKLDKILNFNDAEFSLWLHDSVNPDRFKDSVFNYL